MSNLKRRVEQLLSYVESQQLLARHESNRKKTLGIDGQYKDCVIGLDAQAGTYDEIRVKIIEILEETKYGTHP